MRLVRWAHGAFDSQRVKGVEVPQRYFEIRTSVTGSREPEAARFRDNIFFFLILLGVIYPAIAGVMFTDFFFYRKREWVDKRGWNWVATFAFTIGGLIGYLTQYHLEIGIPAVQSLLISAAVYWLGIRLKARLAPDHFTTVHTGTASKGAVHS